MKPEQIMAKLKEQNMEFLIHTHPPLYTVEEAKEYDEMMPGGHCKNMLLTNKKRSKYILVILEANKRMNFKDIGKLVGVNGLKFAKEETLNRFNTFSGSVSPFIVLEDEDNEIAVFMDDELLNYDLINFHPNINDMTLGLKTNEFVEYMKTENHELKLITY